ncbi:MAG: putative YigZ family protein [Planctomycetota bacterium]|jgi:uncharacterized YigZ family protein
MSDSYRTIAEALEHEPDKIKGSRHIASVFPVKNVDEIEAHLAAVRARMNGANHHAYAWRLGRGENDFRYSDDGEPSGSAGRPMLKHIDGQDLTDVLVIVSRYFGGTKLGTGGLVRAYGGAAQEALELADIVEVIPHATIRIQHAYEDSGALASVLNTFALQPLKSDYGTQVDVSISVPQSLAEEFERAVRDATAARARIEVTPSDRA